MIKLLVGGKGYFGAKKIAERLVKDIEGEQVGTVYRFIGLDDSHAREKTLLNRTFDNLLSECDDNIYYSYEFDSFKYKDNEKYTIYGGKFLSVDEAIKRIEEDIDELSALRRVLCRKK